MSENAIELQDVTQVFGVQGAEWVKLRRRFKPTEADSNSVGIKHAINGLTLDVPTGSVFGFLGPNGAGKTTTIRAIMGHLQPTSGEVRTLGADPWTHDEAERRRVAYVSENMNIPSWMTPEQAIRFCAAQYPKWREVLAFTLLGDFELRGAGPYGKLSKGQKQRVTILLALCQNADLLVMDEPASALDVVARHDFLEHVIDVACNEERTVFMSSHLLSDLERVVDRIAIINKGQLRLEGELDAIKAGVRKLHLPTVVGREVVEGYFQVIRFEERAGETLATVLDFDEERFRALCEAHDVGRGAEQVALNLEDLFVEVQKGDGRAGNAKRETDITK